MAERTNRKRRTKLVNTVWENVEPSINGYSRLIQNLLDTMTEKQLAEFVKENYPED